MRKAQGALIPEAVVSPFSLRVEAGEALEIRDLERMSTHSEILYRSCSGQIGLPKPVGQSKSAVAVGSSSLFQASLSQVGSMCKRAQHVHWKMPFLQIATLGCECQHLHGKRRARRPLTVGVTHKVVSMERCLHFRRSTNEDASAN